MSWREDLPEDIRGSDALKDVEDVGSLAQQFISSLSTKVNSLVMRYACPVRMQHLKH